MRRAAVGRGRRPWGKVLSLQCKPGTADRDAAYLVSNYHLGFILCSVNLARIPIINSTPKTSRLHQNYLDYTEFDRTTAACGSV